MSLSYAANLGHIPPINGLYSFVFNPVMYALLGTCPQMVVGPEAAGSLLVGTVVTTCIDRGDHSDNDDVLNAQVAGVVTGMAGAVIFVAGLTRLGFLDSVLSRPFLRGFISAIGFVILADQAIPELGLSPLAAHVHGVVHGSSASKIAFLFTHIGQSHGLTAAVSITSFVVIMVFRTIKRKMQPRYPSVAYFPDRFIVVVLSALLTWKFGWDKQGLEVLGNVESTGKHSFVFHWPFQFKHMKHIDTAMSTSFLIALLGFFESSVAAKSLGEGTHELRGMSLSANRELIALGAANILGGCFMALPAFGGYGRSKVNASTGGTTPMSSILLSLITLLSVLFLLPYMYFLPKGVLSAMISVVAYSLIEECPHDIKFFIKIRGWTELFLMVVIFLSTVFYSLSLGIALGIGLSLLNLVKHATSSRTLSTIPRTLNMWKGVSLSKFLSHSPSPILESLRRV
jgi:MFS superfamily sulfate permease-like transporter